MECRPPEKDCPSERGIDGASWLDHGYEVLAATSLSPRSTRTVPPIASNAPQGESPITPPTTYAAAYADPLMRRIGPAPRSMRSPLTFVFLGLDKRLKSDSPADAIVLFSIQGCR